MDVKSVIVMKRHMGRREIAGSGDAGGKFLAKKNPHIMWGKTGMVSMARKTGCYWLLPVLLLLDNFSDELCCIRATSRSCSIR